MLRTIVHAYRHAYAGLSPEVWWLSVIMLINRSGTMVLPFMSLYVTRKLGFSLDSAGLVISCFGLGAVVGGALGGRVADKIGFQKTQLLALAGGGGLFFVLGFLKTIPQICACAFILSTINEAFRPANAMAIAAYSKLQNRTRSYSLNRLAINLGWAAGGTLGGFIAAHDYHLLFWVDGISNLSAAGLLLFLIRRKPRNSVVSELRPEKKRRNDAMRDRKYMLFILLTFLYAACFFQLFSTQPVFYREVLGVSEQIIGLAMAVNGLLIASTEMLVVHGLEKRPRNPLTIIACGTVVLSLSFAVFNAPLHPMVLLFGSVILMTLGEMLSMPFQNSFWVSRSTERNRGQYAGWFTVAWAAAQVTGPYAGSTLAATLGFPITWWIVSATGMVAALGYFLLGRKEGSYNLE